MSSGARLVLRVGVAFAFLYPPIDAIFEPYTWFGYFPHFVLNLAAAAHLPNLVLLHGFGAVEVILALWILSGWRVTIPAVAATLMLVAIVLSDLGEFSIIFRDLAIASGSLALALDSWKPKAV